ncbi:MAG: trypsin-like peptidase domain-containing protein [Vicinamibacterales bacterium]
MRLAVAAVTACLGLSATASADGPGQAVAVRQTAPAISLNDLSTSFEALVARMGPSIVQVIASGLVVDPDAATTDGLVERRRSSGSGVILDPAGYVMTNYHVVQGARRVQVVLAGAQDGQSIVRPRGRTLDATVAGVDEETDLALLKVAGAGLPALPLGDSDTLRAGQLVFAFGSPLGLDNSVTMGVVSAVGRQLEADDPMVYIQTDAPINPGSSGGPLVNAAGQVVGINTLILSQGGGNEGLGFAAPSNIVRTVYDQLRQYGRVRRGSIGTVVQSITAVMARALALPRESGAIVADVDPAGPAAAAGLRVGDIVVSLDGKAIENGRQLDVNLYRRAAGDVAQLVVLRGDQTVNLPVAVGERDDDPLRFAEMVTRDEHLIPRLGVLALTLTDTLRAEVGVGDEVTGALVAARAAESAAEYGVAPGDLVVSVNRVAIRGLDDFRQRIAALPANAPCALQVLRQGQFLFLAFEIE